MEDLPYFDGDSRATVDFTYAWTGVPHASTSMRFATPGLWVEAFTDAPVPRVGITVTGLDAAGPSVVTVWRTTSGGARRAVRGWKKRIIYGSDYYIDYEAPLGREVTYSLEVHSGAAIPARTSDTVTLDCATGFVQDPLMPLGAVPVGGGLDLASTPVLTSDAFRKLRYEVASSSASVMGRREPVAMTGQRMAVSGVDFSVLTEAAEQGTSLRNLLAEAPLVLVRPLPEWGPLPDLVYTVPSVTEQPVYGEHGPVITQWTLQGDSVAAPSMQVLVALWTYDQVAALWATYSEAQAAASTSGATYLDNQRDPTMGV